jgi:hypothetical protein
MRVTIGELRRIIRRALREGPSGPGVAADPTDVKGFYSYDVERGADIHGYWYRSPGDKGSSDPGRPEDAEDYIGMKPPASSETAPESETTED